MKKHDFLNLKIGDIEQYSLVVKKADLEHWRKSGWLPFTEIGLPEGDEEADFPFFTLFQFREMF